MVERNLLGSNLMSFLDAATSGMIAPLFKKTTSYDGRIKCARRARTASSVRAKLLFHPTKTMIPPLVSKINPSPFLTSLPHRDCSAVDDPAARTIPPALEHWEYQ